MDTRFGRKRGTPLHSHWHTWEKESTQVEGPDETVQSHGRGRMEQSIHFFVLSWWRRKWQKIPPVFSFGENPRDGRAEWLRSMGAQSRTTTEATQQQLEPVVLERAENQQ